MRTHYNFAKYNSSFQIKVVEIQQKSCSSTIHTMELIKQGENVPSLNWTDLGLKKAK